MPFKKIRHGKHRGKYRSPSGRVFTRSQVRRYYARGRSFDGYVMLDTYDPNQPRGPDGRWVEVGSLGGTFEGLPGRHFRITTPKNVEIGLVANYDPETETVNVEWIQSIGSTVGDYPEPGTAEMRAVYRMMGEMFPKAKRLQGERITGARVANPMIARRKLRDAADDRRDPTGTERLRRRARTVLDRRWTVLRGLVRDAIVVRDMFGVERVDADNVQHVAGAGRLEAFRSWFDSAIDLSVVSGTDWLGGQLHLGYLAGVGHASRAVGRKLAGDAGKPDLLAAASQSELRGVADAVSQRATRAFAESLVTRRSARVTGHAVMRAVSDVGRNRGRVLIDYMTTRAHAEGTLDALQSGGVSRVGLVVEHLPHRHVGDAEWDPDEHPRDPEGRFVEKTQLTGSLAGRSLKKTIEMARMLSKRGHVVSVTSMQTKRGATWYHANTYRVVKNEDAREKISLDARRRGPRSLSRAVQREERRIEGLGSPVGVQTAGDDLVCKKCERIAAEGPYEIDRARGLIPAHPHCRCVFVPADEED